MANKDETITTIQHGISAVRREEYMLAYVLLTEAYASEDTQLRHPEGLSHFGLALALMDKKFKSAIDFCNQAIELQFYNAEAYLNLAKVYEAAGARRKAVESLDRGLEVVPDHTALKKMRDSYGYRKPPAVPFLDRGNAVNKAIGIARTQPETETGE